jgi:hypothetical protein
MDGELSRNRKTHKGHVNQVVDAPQQRSHIQSLRSEACGHLVEAGAIYSLHNDYSGSGNVEATYGYLNLDNGDFDLASARGMAAYRIAQASNDLCLKARARFLQSAIEHQKAEEQIGDPASPRKSSRLSSEYAHEASEIAKQTQNRPLIAQSYVTLGLALLNDGDIEDAHECYKFVATYLKSGTRDYLSRQLQQLKGRLASVGTVEPTLREWSRGIVKDKTFQEITEDFAAIVIPKVWKREGCRVSAVTAQLSISPKKVRRILRSQGYLVKADTRSKAKQAKSKLGRMSAVEPGGERRSFVH